MDRPNYSHLTAIIVPTDYCNMDCVYCFNKRRTCTQKKQMTYNTLRNTFKCIIPYYDDIRFIWHGGEPLSMGLDFFRDVIAMQKEYNTNNARIENSIQTNLTLLNDTAADFFLSNNYIIGGSYDGLTNDLTRHNSSGIMNGFDLLKRRGYNCPFIYVVQRNNIDCLIDDYEWFKRKGINYTINIYMSEHLADDPLCVPSDYFAQRICELFDHWLNDTQCNIEISYFDVFVRYICLGVHSICKYNSCLGRYVCVLHDGRVFCCNRDFPNEFCLGNVNEYADIRRCFDSDGFRRLLQCSIIRRNDCRQKCEIYDFCQGGCNSSASMCGDMSTQNEYECNITISVYKYIYSRIIKLINNDQTAENINPYVVSLLQKVRKNEQS